VIFDLDGTLTDSADGIVSSFRHALGEIGAAVPEGDLASQIVGPPMHHTFEAMGLDEHAEAAIAAYRADYTARGWAINSLFDGIGPLLADLRAAGVRLAVATSKAEPTAQRILADRRTHGPFRKTSDLMRVKGIGPKTLARLLPSITVGAGRDSSR